MKILMVRKVQNLEVHTKETKLRASWPGSIWNVYLKEMTPEMHFERKERIRSQNRIWERPSQWEEGVCLKAQVREGFRLFMNRM